MALCYITEGYPISQCIAILLLGQELLFEKFNYKWRRVVLSQKRFLVDLAIYFFSVKVTLISFARLVLKKGLK